MSEISIRIPLVDGSESAYGPEFASGKDFINRVVTDDWGAPPQCLVIEGTADGGRALRVVIPYSTTDTISVFIDGKRA